MALPPIDKRSEPVKSGFHTKPLTPALPDQDYVGGPNRTNTPAQYDQGSQGKKGGR